MRIIGNAEKTREVQAVASGVLSTGDSVVVNSDGTVSSIGVASNSVTSPTAFNSTNTTAMRSALDTATGKIMILYQASSWYVVMATISGNTVSFGTPTLVSSGNVLGDISYDEESGHFLLVYQGASNYGRARVASVSGTNITLSTELVWASYVATKHNLSYDTVRKRHMNVYMNEATNNLKARVFKITGTTPSAGGEGSVNSGANICSSIAYASDLGQHLVSYQDYSDSQQGKCSFLRVSAGSDYMAATLDNTLIFASEGLKNGGRDGTQTVYDTVNNVFVISYVNLSGVLKILTGTPSGYAQLSFGSTTTINSVSGGNNIYFSEGGAFDPVSGKVIVTYCRNGTSGMITTAKVSGSSVGSLSTTTFESANVPFFTTTFNPDSGSALVFYRDAGNNDYGTYTLFTPGATNLTSENYIGTAATGAPDGQGAKIKIKGAVDENQSGLTAGKSYYISPTNGALSTTPSNPSVFAGTAVAANKLIVKG